MPCILGVLTWFIGARFHPPRPRSYESTSMPIDCLPIGLSAPSKLRAYAYAYAYAYGLCLLWSPLGPLLCLHNNDCITMIA